MTLPENEEVKMPAIQHKKDKPVGACLAKVLNRAKDENRLVCGVFECASHLENTPEKVMMCLLPEGATNQISVAIQHKLIEAHCLENGIQVVKIDGEKLNTLLNASTGQQTENNMPVTSPSLDTSCVLIEWPPKVNANKNENRLLDLIWPNQVVDLPI